MLRFPICGDAFLEAHRQHSAALLNRQCTVAAWQRCQATSSFQNDVGTSVRVSGVHRDARVNFIVAAKQPVTAADPCFASVGINPTSARATHLHRATGEQAAHGGLVRRAQGLVQERNPVLQAVPQGPVPHLLHVARHALRRHLATQHNALLISKIMVLRTLAGTIMRPFCHHPVPQKRVRRNGFCEV